MGLRDVLEHVRQPARLPRLAPLPAPVPARSRNGKAGLLQTLVGNAAIAAAVEGASREEVPEIEEFDEVFPLQEQIGNAEVDRGLREDKKRKPAEKRLPRRVAKPPLAKKEAGPAPAAEGPEKRKPGPVTREPGVPEKRESKKEAKEEEEGEKEGAPPAGKEEEKKPGEAIAPAAGAAKKKGEGEEEGAEKKKKEGDAVAAGTDEEARAGGEAVEKAPAPEGGGGPAASVEAGEVEEAAPLASWKAGVSRAIQAIPPPAVAGGPEGAASIQGGAKKAGARGAAKRGGLAASAKRDVPDPPEPPEKPSLPPEPDPVPEATALVKDLPYRALPDQTLPAMEKSPKGNIPTEGNVGALSEAEGFDAEKHSEEMAKLRAQEGKKADGEEKDGKKDDPNQKRAREIKEKTAQKKEVETKEVPGAAVTIKDEGPPKPRKLVKGQKETVAGVLAQLLANPGQEAEKMMNQAREQAYPEGVLASVYKDIGSDKVAGLTEDLVAELGLIQREAGISNEMLQKKVEERKAELEKQKADAQQQQTDAHKTAVDEVTKEGQKTTDSIRGTAEQVKINAEQTLEASAGSDDPKVIEAKRDRLIGKIHTLVADRLGVYRNSEKRRGDALDKAARKQGAAYRDTGEREARQTVSEAGTEPTAQSTALLESMKIRAWATTQIGKVSTLVRDFKAAVATLLGTSRKEVTDGGDQAVTKIREWADARTGTQRSWWQKFFDKLSDWVGLSKKVAEQWEVATAQEERDSILQDAADLDSLIEQAQSGVDLNALIAQGKLTQEQIAVLSAFFGQGPDRGNKLAAVASVMRMRIFRRRKPELISQFDEELAAKPNEEWQNLETITAAQGGGFNAASISDRLYSAMFGGLTGWGTDEAEIFSALGSLSKLQGITVRKCYAATYSRDLDADLASELSGAEKDRAVAQLEGKQAEAEAAALYEAMHGGITGWGTDEEAINKALRGKSDTEREAIIAEYKRVYNIDLKADLKSELSDYELHQSMAYAEGKTAEGDAAGLQQAMKGGLTGWGTDEAAIDNTYKQIREDVKGQAAREGWSTAKMEAEILRRNQEVESAFNQKYGVEYGNPSTSALRVAFKDELSGGELRLANAMADVNMAAADAARLDIEFNSIITDDDAVNEVLGNQYKRAYEDLTRDQMPGLKAKLEIQAEKDRQAGHPWPPEKWRDEERKLDRQIAKDAQAVAQVNTDRMTAEYEKHDFGPGSLRFRVYMTTSGVSGDEAITRLKQGGYLTPEQQVDFAIKGWGTKEKLLDEALDGKTPEEIKDLKTKWEALHPGKNFEAEVLDEFSGREAFDYKQKLKGEPQTPEEKQAREMERINYELTTYPLAGFFAGTERKAMEKRRDEMMASQQALQDARRALEDPKLPVEERKRLTALAQREYDRFSRRVESAHTAVEMHRKQIDAATDGTVNIVSTVVAVVVAVVVSAAIIVASAGTATPGVIALWAGIAGAAAAGAATIATKQAMKGSAYGMEEMGVDIALTLVDIAVTAATAGIGDKILKAARIAAIAGKGAWQRAGMKLLAEGAENLVQALPNAFARNALNDKVWESTDTASLLAESTLADTLTSLPTSMLASKVMGPVAEFGTNKLVGLSTRLLPGSPLAKSLRGAGSKMVGEDLGQRSPDLLAHIGTPEERLALWHDYKVQNPEATYLEFRDGLIEGKIDRLKIEETTKDLHRSMREELLSGIPPADRALFTDTPIRVVSDAEFDHLTGSYSGEAYVRVSDGKLQVIVRESAPVSALAEEGKHLRQSIDPKHAEKFLLLDEARLRKWNQMTVDEKLAAYRAKLDLEIDAQKSLLQDVHQSRSKVAPDSEAAASLAKRKADGERTLGNLEKRMGEVNAISAESRLETARGKRDLPEFLEQPPRLFSKASDDLVASMPPEHTQKVKELLGEIGGNTKSEQKRGMFEQITATAKQLSTEPERAIDFLKSADTLLKKMPKNTGAVNDALIAASRAAQPDVFLKKVADIAAHPGIGDKTFKELTACLKESPKRALGALDAAAELIHLNPDVPGNPGRSIDTVVERIKAFQEAAGGSKEMKDLGTELAGQSSEMVKRNLEAIQKGYPPPPKKAVPDDYFYIATEDGFELRKMGGGTALEIKPKPGNEKGYDVVPKDTTRKTFGEKKTAWAKDVADPKKHTPNPTVEALIKKAGMDQMSAEDLAPIRRWQKPLAKLHEELKVAAGEKHADEAIRGLLATLREAGYGEAAYDKFRHALREKAVQHVLFDFNGKPRTVAEQDELFKRFLDLQPDNASRGEFASTYREKWMKLEHEKGVSKISPVEDPARRLSAITDEVRMVDGAVNSGEDIEFTNQITGEDQVMKKGCYLTEDKASVAAFDLDQAKRYSGILDTGGTIDTKSKDGRKAAQAGIGIIVVLPDAKQAGDVAKKIAAANLNPNVHVAYRGPDGKLIVIR